ncbi:YdcF family protein [Prochlorococcus sp. MIT 1300]|uniref:YdcF family protein n=1 Tax=Prochlorococcus sp. MIT 1300 TaxID=3096218 RepID=UPI002A75A151|nr:YdcF family protein [Prochlorococcus sp. MIT 1300]
MLLKRSSFFIIAGLSIWLIIRYPLRPYLQASRYLKSPELVFVLGGDIKRELAGIGLANTLNLPLIISGGSNPEYAHWMIKESGVPKKNVKLDYRAKDTLENFTSIVEDLHLKGINHALLVTSEDHLARALLMGNLIAGSRGIKLTPIAISCAPECKKESLPKKLFDLFRAVGWIITGQDPKDWAKQNFPKVTTFSEKIFRD